MKKNHQKPKANSQKLDSAKKTLILNAIKEALDLISVQKANRGHITCPLCQSQLLYTRFTKDKSFGLCTNQKCITWMM